MHVMTRAAEARELALSLGCASAQGAADPPPEPLDAAILFAPGRARSCFPALEALDRGGRLAIAGIHLSDIPPLNYDGHLFEERELVSVTANTRRDGEEFLALAAEIPIRATTTEYPFEQGRRRARGSRPGRRERRGRDPGSCRSLSNPAELLPFGPTVSSASMAPSRGHAFPQV